jgi:hypothetical protein
MILGKTPRKITPLGQKVSTKKNTAWMDTCLEVNIWQDAPFV